MIEIVFGESACGSLKIAQTYGKGKYRGSAVSIFMRHEDGSVPSSDEMKKAQLQAQEQERIAWENAIPLGGKSCDVYCFDMALSVGDISGNEMAAWIEMESTVAEAWSILDITALCYPFHSIHPGCALYLGRE